MEMEFFIKPDTAEEEKWYRYWVDFRYNWHVKYGLKADHLRRREHGTDELSHYSSGTTDLEFLYPFGWGELEGVAKRGSFDLDQHAKASGRDLTYFDEEAKTRYRPWVIEPALGVDRSMLAPRSRSIRCCAKVANPRRRTRCARCCRSSSRRRTIRPDRSDAVIGDKTRSARRSA